MAYKLTAANVSRVLRQAGFAKSERGHNPLAPRTRGYAAHSGEECVRVRWHYGSYTSRHEAPTEELVAALREHGWVATSVDGRIEVREEGGE